MKTIACAAALLLFFCANVNAQTQITGKVFDTRTQEPLPGANIFVPSDQTGTTSDASGSFRITLNTPGDTIRVSFIGYKTEFVAVMTASVQVPLEPVAQTLQMVTVSASRDVQARSEIPATINSVSSEAIRETNPTQLNQVVNKVPGVVMKDLNSEQHMMSIRQPMTSRPYFLYLEDGLPVAPVGNFNHNQLIEVNMLAIRTVEVIKGPASSIYGSNAVGGAINFITQSPGVIPVARVGYQQNNYGYRRIEFFAGNQLTPKFGLCVGGYMAEQRNSWQTYSDFDKVSLSAKAVYYVSSRSDVTAYFTTNSLYTQTGGSVDSAGFYSRKYLANNNFSYRKVNGFRSRMTWNKYWNENSKTAVSVYTGKNTIGQNPRYRIKNVNVYSAKGEENEDSYFNYGSLVQHVQRFRFLNSRLTAGVTANYAPTSYRSTYGTITRDTVTGYYTGFTSTDSLLADYRTILVGMAVYAQYEFSPVKNLRVTVGARYDRLSYSYDNHLNRQAFSGVADTTIANAAFSPKLGVTYDLGNNRGAYASYSKGFSPPQTSDLFFGTKIPVLQPSSFTNYEAGVWAAFFNGKLFADVCVYRLEGVNEIISFRLADNSTENRNSGRTLHQGVEYSLTWKPMDDIFLRAGGTNAVHKYIDYDVQQTGNGELISYDGNYMPEAPAYIANAELMIKPRFVRGLRLSIEWQGIGKWYKNDANTVMYDDKTLLLRGVSLLHVRCGYTWKSLELYCNITNLTNELYANGVTRGSNNKDTFSAGAPRIVAVGVNWKIQGNAAQ